ncbi:MAG: PAS domain S-box protein [Crinalium sp.]
MMSKLNHSIALNNALVKWWNELAWQGIFTTDANLNIHSWNHWLEMRTGYAAQEMIGRNLLLIYPELVARRLDRFYDQALNGQVAILSQSLHGYLLATPPNACYSTLTNMLQSARIAPLIEDNQVIGTLTIIEDVTEKVMREAELQHQIESIERAELTWRSTHARLQHLLTSSPAVIYTCQPDGDYYTTFVSNNVMAQLGYSPQHFLQKPKFADSYIHSADVPHILAELPYLFVQGHHVLEYRFLHQDGSYRWIRDEMKLVRNPDGSVQEIVGAWYDITESKNTQAQLQEQAALLNIIRDAIVVQDLKKKILFCNQAAEKLYGWKAEEAIGKNSNQLLYKTVIDRVENANQTVLQEGEWQGELYLSAKDGSEIIVDSNWTLVRDERGNPKYILTVNTDITEKKQLQTQFLRTQRMESLGTLAGGIAHDLNNVLTPILMSVQLLQLKLEDEQSQEWLDILETNVKRGAALVKQVLSFARGCEGDRKLIQVRHLISEIKQIVKETFPKYIELHTDVISDLWSVSGDATQLHQVLVNLCVNARDAMPNGGKLSISAQNIYLDENYARMNIEAKVGHYIAITVSDTGIGIKNEILDRIFEPFFTTKELGQGTGLGLSTVIGIIKSHGGFVKVSSKVGEGTEFKVYLPAVQENVIEQLEHLQLPQGNGELILVVDDEAPIREITEIALQKYSYRVLTASDGIEALALYAQHKDEISLVLIDMMMPYMDGLTTIRTLKKINPNVKIIAVSGLISQFKIEDFESINVKTFLSKPYIANELLTTLHEVLSNF